MATKQHEMDLTYTYQNCSTCRTPTDGAPLCDRCARRLRNACRGTHKALTAGVRVGSGTIANLRRDEALLAEYDAHHAHHNFTCGEMDDG